MVPLNHFLLLSGLLFGISPHDPLTFVALAVGLMMVALLATWIPARRAATASDVTPARCSCDARRSSSMPSANVPA